MHPWHPFFLKPGNNTPPRIRRWILSATSMLLPAVLWLYPLPIAGESCLPAIPPFMGYSFLHPLVINPNLPGAPYFLEFESLYQRYGRQQLNQPDENVAEWRQRFCDIPDEDAIRSLIYGFSMDDFVEMRLAITLKTSHFDSFIKENAFARYLVRHRCLETVEYLIFAKECEPFVANPEDPWESTQKDYRRSGMDRLIENGLKAFLKTQSHYIRLRYAYQIIRLAHYSRQYERTLELFDYLTPKMDHDPSVIEYWILGHKAGALMALNRPVEAAYLYARVFLNSPGKRESAFRSFRIQTDEEWRQCLLLCENDQERTTLYTMRAYMRDSKAVEEMEAIYQLDPVSPYLPVLLAREIQKLERHLLGNTFNDHQAANRRYHGIPSNEVFSEIIRLQQLVKRIQSEGVTPNKPLWTFGLGYLQLLAGDSYAARQSFEETRDLTENDILAEQTDALLLVNEIASWQSVNTEMEEAAARAKLDNPLYKRYPSFPDFLSDKMAWLYTQNDLEGKAFLVNHNLQELKANPTLSIIEDLIDLSTREHLNRFERDLLRQANTSSLRSDLLDLRATQFFNEGNLAAAFEAYKEIDRNEWDNYGLFSPFVERFTECVHCKPRDTSALINKGQLFEKLLDLEYRAIADREHSGPYWYQLGLAYYNMSYFGYAWKVRDYFRSGSSLKKSANLKTPNLVSHPRYPLGNMEYFDCTKAMECFELARKTTKDPELAAKAVFMAARCEQNEAFSHHTRNARQYFEVLNRNYFNTRFYKIMVQECKYLQAYAAK